MTWMFFQQAIARIEIEDTKSPLSTARLFVVWLIKTKVSETARRYRSCSKLVMC